MFGLGFGEMVLLGVVLLVVVGPKELPKLLRSLGRGINKLKNMSQDLRDQSGIDDILDDEGLRDDLQAIRSIARPGSVAAGLVTSSGRRKRPVRRPAVKAPALDDLELPDGEPPDSSAENPIAGPDAYGAPADDVEPDQDEQGPSSTERPTTQSSDGADDPNDEEPATAKEGT